MLWKKLKEVIKYLITIGFAEVIALGEVDSDGVKSCTNKIQIVRELSWEEVLKIVNTGKNCTGLCNTGNRNRSSYNTGCFMTKEFDIEMFNRPSDWSYRDWLNSSARYILNGIPKNIVEWISEDDMTEEEKK